MSAHEWLDGLVGASSPGACDDCGASQSMSKDSSGIYVLTVAHDDTCPELARREKRTDRWR